MRSERQDRARHAALVVASLVACVALVMWLGPSQIPAPAGGSGQVEPLRTPGRQPAPVVLRPQGDLVARPVGVRDPAAADATVWGALVVRVVDAAGRPEPGAWAEDLDCPGFRVAPPHRPLAPLELAYTAPEGRCVLRAARMDGLVKTRSQPIAVWVPPNDEVRVELTLPVERSGAILFAYAPVERGVRLAWLPPDSPLAQAGFIEGDVILSVDGVPLQGLEPEEVDEALLGPEGTPMLLEVERTGADTGEPVVVVELVRQIIEG